MTVSVFRFGDERPFVFPDAFDGLEVLLFDPMEERGEESLGDRYRSLDPSLLAADVVVLRSSSRALVTQAGVDPILRALGPPHIFTLTRSYDPHAPGPLLTVVRESEVAVNLDVADLSSIEIASILQRADAILAHKDHHFVLPSGWHADRFVRLAKVTKSIVDCRRLADWVLGAMTDRTDLLADTGSLIPVLQEVQRHSHRAFGWQPRIDVLDEYPDVADVAARIQDLRGLSAPEDQEFLFVVSVSSTGSAVDLFEQVVSQFGRGRSLVICDVNPDGAVEMCLTHLPTDRWRPGNDGRCEECGTPAVVVIDPASYDPRTKFDLTPVAIGPRIAGRKQELFQLLSDHDLLKVHYWSEAGRHYAVWVDTARLLNLPEPRAAFSSLIRSLLQSDSAVVLIPDGPARKELLEAAVGAGCPDPHVVPPGGVLSEQAVEQVSSAERVLIIDDVFVSGVTLRRLRRAVYETARSRGRSPEVAAAVFLARPARQDLFAEIGRPYRGTSGEELHWVEEALMPSALDCPWCREATALRGMRSQLTASSKDAVDRRLQRLSGELASPILISGGPDDGRLRTEMSFFGSLSERAAFVAASSAVLAVLEEMRASSTVEAAQIIDIAIAIDGYFDSVLLVGILRTCRKRQVRFASQDPLISGRYGDLAALGDVLSDAARCELAWSVVMELLPRDGFDPVIDDVLGPEAAMLREMLALGGRRWSLA